MVARRLILFSLDPLMVNGRQSGQRPEQGLSPVLNPDGAEPLLAVLRVQARTVVRNPQRITIDCSTGYFSFSPSVSLSLFLYLYI